MSEREQINLLAVDDDPLDLALLRNALSKIEGFDYSIVTVSTPEEALQELSREESFDICLMDLRLGFGKSGIAVIEVCQSVNIQIPFLILTGVKANVADIAHAAKLPLCMGFLSKDITISASLADRTHFDKTIRFAIQKFNAKGKP